MLEQAYWRFVELLKSYGQDAVDLQTFATVLLNDWLEFEQGSKIYETPMGREGYGNYFGLYRQAKVGKSNDEGWKAYIKKISKRPKPISVPKTPKPKAPRPQRPAPIPQGVLAPNPAAPKGYRIVLIDGQHFLEPIG